MLPGYWYIGLRGGRPAGMNRDIETEIVEFEIFKYIMITTSTYTEEVQDKFYQFI